MTLRCSTLIATLTVCTLAFPETIHAHDPQQRSERLALRVAGPGFGYVQHRIDGGWEFPAFGVGVGYLLQEKLEFEADIDGLFTSGGFGFRVVPRIGVRHTLLGSASGWHLAWTPLVGVGFVNRPFNFSQPLVGVGNMAILQAAMSFELDAGGDYGFHARIITGLERALAGDLGPDSEVMGTSLDMFDATWFITLHLGFAIRKL